MGATYQIPVFICTIVNDKSKKSKLQYIKKAALHPLGWFWSKSWKYRKLFFLKGLMQLFCFHPKGWRARRLLQLQKEIPILSRVASSINAHAYALHKTPYRKAFCYCKIKRRFREWGKPVWGTGIRRRSALPGGTGAPGGLAYPRISPFFCTR